MKKLKKYMEKRDLMLNSEKSKVMVFEKGRGSARRREWKWGEDNIEDNIETYNREIEKSNNNIENNMEFRRENI